MWHAVKGVRSAESFALLLALHKGGVVGGDGGADDGEDEEEHDEGAKGHCRLGYGTTPKLTLEGFLRAGGGWK